VNGARRLAVLLALAAFARAEEEDLAPMLEKLRAKHDVPALGAAVLHGPEITAIGASGVRRFGKDDKVTREDRWHLGSCTKSMTATLLGRYVERGRLAWETTLDDPKWAEVTVDDLLRHRGGAPADLGFDGLWARLWKREGTPVEQRALLTAAVLARPPLARGEFLYSNAGYAIAGHLLEVKEKKSWEELMRAQLFEPLGMKSAGFGAPEGRQPWGHVRRDGKIVAIAPGPQADNPPAIGPAGTVHASLRDWAKYVALHLQGAREGERKLLLERATLRRIQTPRKDETYACGWGVAERDWGGGRVLTHAGSNTMWFCVVWIAPKRDFAALVVCNMGGDAAATACDDVAGALVRRLGAR